MTSLAQPLTLPSGHVLPNRIAKSAMSEVLADPETGAPTPLLDRLYERWGAWSLLLAWVPFIGDPLTVAAGALRLRLAMFVPLVAAGKAARYAVLAYAVLQV